MAKCAAPLFPLRIIDTFGWYAFTLHTATVGHCVTAIRLIELIFKSLIQCKFVGFPYSVDWAWHAILCMECIFHDKMHAKTADSCAVSMHLSLCWLFCVASHATNVKTHFQWRFHYILIHWSCCWHIWTWFSCSHYYQFIRICLVICIYLEKSLSQSSQWIAAISFRGFLGSIAAKAEKNIFKPRQY